jgi:hypothetical protein
MEIEFGLEPQYVHGPCSCGWDKYAKLLNSSLDEFEDTVDRWKGMKDNVNLILAHLSDRYDGAPDSATRWLGTPIYFLESLKVFFEE